MTTTFLRPNADVQREGWDSFFASNIRMEVDIYQAINEVDPDGDASYIYTIEPVTSVSRPIYVCKLDDVGSSSVTKAVASVWAKGPVTANVATSAGEEEEEGEGGVHILCHTELEIKVTSDAAGTNVLGTGGRALNPSKYVEVKFTCDIPAAHHGPLYMHFIPALSGGSSERYCRVTQAQIELTH